MWKVKYALLNRVCVQDYFYVFTGTSNFLSPLVAWQLLRAKLWWSFFEEKRKRDTSDRHKVIYWHLTTDHYPLSGLLGLGGGLGIGIGCGSSFEFMYRCEWYQYSHIIIIISREANDHKYANLNLYPSLWKYQTFEASSYVSNDKYFKI